jgi:hypothetical protein
MYTVLPNDLQETYHIPDYVRALEESMLLNVYYDYTNVVCSEKMYKSRS